jgi:hypothetical protein
MPRGSAGYLILKSSVVTVERIEVNAKPPTSVLAYWAFERNLRAI